MTSCWHSVIVLGSFGECVVEGNDAQKVLVHWEANLPVLSVFPACDALLLDLF